MKLVGYNVLLILYQINAKNYKKVWFSGDVMRYLLRLIIHKQAHNSTSLHFTAHTSTTTERSELLPYPAAAAQHKHRRPSRTHTNCADVDRSTSTTTTDS